MDPLQLERALLDPAGVFDAPERVLEAGDLTHDQKREVLRRWLHDARELSVADDEGMSGGEPPLIQRVTDALACLEGGAAREG